MKISDAHLHPDLLYCGSNPENAEPGNPDGDSFREVVRVAAITESGRRFLHAVAFDPGDEDRAERLAAKVKAAGAIDTEHWHETLEIYGSAAWQAADNQRALDHAFSPLAGTVRDY